MELKDKAAVVTGAAGGIGRGIALSLAREGVNVVIADLASAELHAEETKKLVEEAGVEAMVVTCDVTNEAEVQAMAKTAIDRFGHVDILVNNAGVISVAPVMSMTEQQWDLVIDVNLKGTFLCSKAFAAHMVERRSGRIINISSLAGRKGAAGLAHYCATKFGVIGFTQALAMELAAANVTVNAICPGEVDSAMWREVLLPALSAGGGTPDEAWQRFISERVPLGRAQTPEDIGQAAVFLCRADNITGEALNVTGGSEIR